MASDQDGDNQISVKNSKEEPKASMSIFTLGKTYRWISRARILAWFRSAFSSKSAESREQAEMKNKNENEHKEHKPKIFYILPRRHELLTLERRLKRTFSKEEETDESQISYGNPDEIKTWIRKSSGAYEEKYLDQYNDKLMLDATKKSGKLLKI